MRRSDRLSEIIEIVRDGRLHLARDIAETLGVSVRTVYRDMDTLAASGVPLEGERGVGYLLREPVFLPPMTLSMAELEALHLGMAIVTQAADEELQAAARTLLTKVAETSSNRRTTPKNWGFGVYPLAQAQLGFKHMPTIRAAIRAGERLRITYHALDATTTTRTVRPLQIEYWGQVWTLSTWCELRQAFRAFRIDRITACVTTGQQFKPEPGKTIQDYLNTIRTEGSN
ncbi:YafY family protein [Sulfitobacter sp. 20_GPM-1509m]|uniref:helix-turn-helix transcriptional regulator n=1 Tax=Sulfitobacter sp. 20_GPM-1509m TaxID=1380367 RepID=UPI00048E137F|nr:YafY family protein [Sulfitobacter sp. 20_GPM-1509m]